MAKLPWKPWHEVVELRDELKTDELTMSMFATDLDEVITIGELFNHLGKVVEPRTQGRQTPLLSRFPDDGGGNVALFKPGARPAVMSAVEQLEQMRQTNEEQLEELRGFSDAVLVDDLERGES